MWYKLRFRLLPFLVVIVLMMIPLTVQAKGETAVFTVDKVNYTVAGKVMKMDSAPFVENGRTLVPVRFLATSLGVLENDIAWNAAMQEATLKKGSKVMTLTIGSPDLVTNGIITKMDTAPLIRNERTYLPARYVAEALGYQVSWDAISRSVLVTSAAQTHGIEISNFSFNPAILTIRAGDTVIWTNKDSVKHTVTADAFGSALLGSGESFSFTFTKAGIFTYHCSPHPTMNGSISVE